jgi:murein L,D-transpeptidase YafK
MDHRNKKMTTYHLSVNIENALKQKSLLFFEDENGNQMSTYSAKKFLMGEQAKGKKYFTGCDNESPEGKCLGHPDL